MKSDETRQGSRYQTTGTRVLCRHTPHARGALSCAKKERNRCLFDKRPVIWPATSLLAKLMPVQPPGKPHLQLCASMRGCAGNSAHPWELTVFVRSLLALWLSPSRNLPG